MPVDPITAITAGTGLIKGISSIFGGKKKGMGPNSSNYHAIMGKARAADELGLHRLSVLGGGNSGYTGGISQAQATGEGLGDIERSLQNLAGAKQNKAAAQMEKTLMEAQIAESRSRTLLNLNNSKRGLVGPTNNPTGSTGGLEQLARDPGNVGSRGVRREPTPDQGATQTVSLGDNTAVGPNPEAFEVGLSELAAGALIYGPQWAAQAFNRGQSSRAASPPQRQGKFLGENVRVKHVTFQWTKSGWKSRITKKRKKQ